MFINACVCVFVDLFRVGGEKVMLLSAAAWGAMTAFTPILAHFCSQPIVSMTVSRFLMGLLQGEWSSQLCLYAFTLCRLCTFKDLRILKYNNSLSLEKVTKQYSAVLSVSLSGAGVRCKLQQSCAVIRGNFACLVNHFKLLNVLSCKFWPFLWEGTFAVE